jgi:hypothetical protein
MDGASCFKISVAIVMVGLIGFASMGVLAALTTAGQDDRDVGDVVEKFSGTCGEASLMAAKNRFRQVLKFCIVEWLMEARQLPIPFRYRINGGAGDEKDWISSLQKNVGDLKSGLAIEPNVENGAVNPLAPERFEGVPNAAERAHRLAAEGTDQIL